LIRKNSVRVFFQILILGASGIFASAQLAFADAPPAGGTAGQPSFFQMVVPFVLMFGVVWFLMIRPQQARMKEQKNMLSQLKEGDEVITSSGILGTIRGMADTMVTLEIADKVRIKILKSQISQVVKGTVKDVAV
jgi:preprotein translocase subunit YajC